MRTPTRLEKIKEVLGDRYPTYTLKQITDAVYIQGINDFANISTLRKELRQELKEKVGELQSLNVISETHEPQARKILFETQDGHRIESVQMIYKPNEEREMEHSALCISTQSGCAMGCKFCATGALGLKRNLTADEITDQLLYFIQNKIRIDSVFFSGMGEPFANPNFFDALDIFTKLMKLSSRKLSVSTVGIIPGIKELTARYPQVNLALSLHSPFPNQREEIMPATRAYPLNEVISTLDEHIKQTNRKVFLAYTLLGGVNDTPEHAKELAKLVRNRGEKAYLYHVNLIKFHPGPTKETFEPSNKTAMENFCQILKNYKIDFTIRQDFGSGIEAACGQLYAKYQKVPQNSQMPTYRQKN